ncbi:MAG: response regulator transcription factor [Saprospiraceae bacterium]|nr:response regulator transcription factor [Saprospiraceae bacterium]
MNSIHLAIIEDDKIVRDSLLAYFILKEDIASVTTFHSMEAFTEDMKEHIAHKPHIILLDIQLPGMTGIDGIPIIKNILPDSEIIMLTTFEDSDKIFSALCAGACSYLSKQSSLSLIYECVITVKNGGSYMSPSIARKITRFFSKENSVSSPLTKRQTDIVHGLVDGLSYKMVAARLDISIDTVRTHIMQIYRTLNINCKGELIRWAIENRV